MSIFDHMYPPVPPNADNGRTLPPITSETYGRIPVLPTTDTGAPPAYVPQPPSVQMPYVGPQQPAPYPPSVGRMPHLGGLQQPRIGYPPSLGRNPTMRPQQHIDLVRQLLTRLLLGG